MQARDKSWLLIYAPSEAGMFGVKSTGNARPVEVPRCRVELIGGRDPNSCRYHGITLTNACRTRTGQGLL